ncbi:phospho-N-acetylmuramoyl-pentapeptide-transferase [Ligilactobacillus saerimneri]|uniref:phospho-N-acetylmuramoyl-pentapeptide- transferase n=1 Tax=Ligilactobacillus saerimneri TaxID=228229 RepID=UPI001C106C8C|nr:phospho-N-acetylmuramoyl-pentapeptide-transferase [Ligilactobacillus saerimneri]MBU5309348.1 phospho-N-acetylmuramoyl-pentapeptide-transferase [Ligilactobacillus saerimneri]MCZ0891919.1 phospho-N-acetylmuramoyl-pentapeptide-transferase [Ligilactobacillus saerimneri]MDI9205934.1 phospho-N-acetylmuramoyl-pentapeptide-transferase [Ligilactobacillus saerimneri]MDY4003974.1 phospho-N-acetylmuramoyl-pentapeptide-transferase [Ligilactobacillus saerimneri]HJF29171.1 phospho-N-acetylmuramoyl-pentape
MTNLELVIPLLSSFILTLIFTPVLIKYAHQKHMGQMIREEGPQWHQKKAGTPTMGGFVFNFAILITCLWTPLVLHQMTPQILVLDFILMLYGFLGFWDDSIKLLKKQNEGLTARQKLFGQIIGAVVFLIVYWYCGLPFSLNFFGYELNLGIIYVLFVAFWLVGFSNAVNLTDGIDGLVTGQAIIAFGAYGVIAYVENHTDILLFCIAVIGALLAFMFYNHKPAKIFMGDMGSLALGGALAATSILLHHELSLLAIGIIFVAETLSVILQVASFKLTGKRIFLMSPIHHHFEKLGWSEWRIDITFWLVGLVFAIVTVMIIIN